MPISSGNASTSEALVGSIKSKEDIEISNMLYDPDIRGKLNFVDITSAEFIHFNQDIRSLCWHGQYSRNRKNVPDTSIGSD